MAARKPAVVAAAATHASLNDALLAVQAGMPAFQRDSVNPHFGSAYLALESLLPQVLEVLNKNGVLLTQSASYLGALGGTVAALKTRLTHVATGEFTEDSFPLTSGKDTPQAQGAALTYARRYALMSVLGITADKDDDANSAMPSRGANVQPAAPSTVPNTGDQPFGGGFGSI